MEEVHLFERKKEEKSDYEDLNGGILQLKNDKIIMDDKKTYKYKVLDSELKEHFLTIR